MSMLTPNELREKIEEALDRIPFDGRKAPALYEPLRYMLALGGKRLRPTLLLMAYNLYRDDVDRAMLQAMGLEMYHNSTLLHDDVMDMADKRRGQDTVYKKWGTNQAILSGDTMLLMSYRMVTQVDPELREQVEALFNESALLICEGQQMDMEFETRHDVTEQEYIQMIGLKTSVLLACSLKIGALLGGAPARDAEILYQVGLNMGMAFQLQDDYLDVYGDPKVFGKNIGGDIVCNKKTYLLIQAWQQADEAQRAELKRWVEAAEFDRDEKVRAVTALYDKLGIGMQSRVQIQYFTRCAEDLLAQLSVEADKTSELRSLLRSLVERAS